MANWISTSLHHDISCPALETRYVERQRAEVPRVASSWTSVVERLVELGRTINRDKLCFLHLLNLDRWFILFLQSTRAARTQAPLAGSESIVRNTLKKILNTGTRTGSNEEMIALKAV